MSGRGDPGAPGGASAGRGLRILLAGSLALNLLVAGLFVGAALHRDRDMRPDTALADIGYGPFIAALAPESRRELAAALVARAGSLRQNRDELRQQLRDLVAAIRSEPFDAARISALIDAQETRLRERQAIGRDLMLDQLARMTPAERAAFADALERGFRRGPKFHHDRD